MSPALSSKGCGDHIDCPPTREQVVKKNVLIGLAAVVAVGIAVPMALGASAPVPKATGTVDWAYGSVTGNVTFDAQGTTTNAKGQLAYTDSTGGVLNGVVNCFTQINPTTAIFSGTITSGSPSYMVANPYFIAKVVDGSTSGAARDKIAVWANAGANEAGAPNCSGKPIGDDLAAVTSGNLVVH